MKNFLLLIFVFVYFLGSFSQTPKYRVLNIPVEKNSTALREPLEGGMNAPQFSPIDLNCDGLKDLFVFDRMGDKVLTFINIGTGDDTTYRYAPQYESLFPNDLNSWALIRDYNFDSIPDIFTHANTGTRVYKGSKQGGLLHFDLVSPLLVYLDTPYHVNIWTALDDIPAVVDVNRDGDLDILTFGIFGASVEYYENQTKENEGNPAFTYDSLKYLMATSCWGNFTENSFTNSVNINVSCKGGSGSAAPAEGGDGARHSGSTLYDIDYQNDHDVDLLVGDISYNNLVLVENCVDSSYSNICYYDSAFPACDVMVNMPVFPAAFGIDADNDGFQDIVAAPNARNGSRDVYNVMLYRNTNNMSCNFVYEGDSFLIHHTLDYGTESKPYFFDYNGDGLLDILIGNYGYFRPFTTYKSTIAYLENNGTQTSPSFIERNTDLGNISSYNLVAVHPAFGDLDGDGKEDMLVGELTGFIHFFKNTGGTVASFSSMTTPNYFNIDAGQYSTPFIYDLNGDSLLDLIIGKKDGKLSYYWNFGTKTSPQFSVDSVNTNLGKVNVTQTGYSDGSSAPFIRKEGSVTQLYCGSYRGIVFKYIINPDSLRAGTFQKIDSDFLKNDVGTKATISIADINNDGKLEYLAGNSRGGLTFFSDSLTDAAANLFSEMTTCVLEVASVEKELTMKIYPNPAKDYFQVALPDAVFVNPQIEIFNVLGEKIHSEIKGATTVITVHTSHFSRGFYFIRVTDNGKMFTGKILVE